MMSKITPYKFRVLTPMFPPTEIAWNIVKKCAPYHPSSKRCDLCITEKLIIIQAKEEGLLNKRSEITNKCRHSNKFSLSTILKKRLHCWVIIGNNDVIYWSQKIKLFSDIRNFSFYFDPMIALKSVKQLVVKNKTWFHRTVVNIFCNLLSCKDRALYKIVVDTTQHCVYIYIYIYI